MKEKIIYIVSSLLVLFLLFYVFLPAINLKSTGFYVYLILLIGFAFSVIFMLLKQQWIALSKKRGKKIQVLNYDRANNKLVRKASDADSKYTTKYMIIGGFECAVVLIVGLLIIFGLMGMKMFRAKSYSNQLSLVSGSQQEFAETFNYDNGDVLLPVIDKDLAFRLAEQNLGDYGAQYNIDYENFTLLSVNKNGTDELVRVAPLEFSNFFVAINKMSKGTVGYIEVNVVTSASRLITCDEGLKYMPSALFNKDLDRHIRFKYPTVMYDEKYFEIDDKQNPYWVIPTYTNEIGVLSGRNSTGTIICNPITGEMQRYKIGEEPSWVDRVVVDSLVEEQATNALKYSGGFFNATFGQKKDVFQVSDGYNYFIKDGHTYYVSCITSPNNNDQTSIGFVTIDLKNRQATRYSSVGITEMRARDIAMQDERVKAQALEATWPILIDYRGIPTYFLVLKNDVKAQKMVYINVSDGEMIALGNNIEEARMAYDAVISSEIVDDESKTLEALVTRVRDLGTTIEFLVVGVDKYFSVNVSLNNVARFLSVGDMVKITYQEYGSYNFVKDIQYR